LTLSTDVNCVLALLYLLSMRLSIFKRQRQPDTADASKDSKFSVDNSTGSATLYTEHADARGSTVSQPDDKALVTAVLAGRNAAYARLYDRYASLVRAVCYDTTRNVADAQDLAQDVFLRAYERLEQLRKPESFGPWVIGMARLRCHEWHRRRLRERAKPKEANEVEFAGSEPQNDAHIDQLRQMIAGLPEKERLALHVFYLQERSAEDARRIVGLSRSGFYRALSRARRRLERLLAREMEDTR
jgi:RNA polymerase sigma factor (sigma-70 family)